MKGYKGFDKDMKCQGLQFEVGKDFIHEGELKLCSSGFHFVTNPLDVITYYPPGTSCYAEIEADNIDKEIANDSKRTASLISIKRKISIKEIIEQSVRIITAAGNNACAATMSNYAHTATMDYGAHAATTNDYSRAATVGNYAHAATVGYCAHAATTSEYSHAATAGNYAHAATMSDHTYAATMGSYAHAVTVGNYTYAATTNDYSHATTTGNNSYAATKGQEAIAAGLGVDNKAKGAQGSWLVLAEWIKKDDKWRISDIKTTKIDGIKIKADVYYKLEKGEFVIS